MRIIKRGKLRNFKESIKRFIKELKPYNLNEISDEKVQNLIDLHHLNLKDIRELYSEEYYHRTK